MMHTSRDVPASTSVITAPPGPAVCGRSVARTTRGGDVESSSSQAAGTSIAPAMAASASSEGSAFSFSICDR